MRRFCTALAALLVLVAAPRSALAACPSGGIYAVQNRASTPNFQLFHEFNEAGEIAQSGPLFTLGGVFGMGFNGEFLCAAELDNDNLTDERLADIPYEAFFGQGSRVTQTPMGFLNVESLVGRLGTLFATSLDFGAHRTTLITVDLGTGLGTEVGMASRNVMIVALAYDPIGDQLFAAAIPFGAGEPSAVDVPTLYVIDRETGAETEIGPLGVEIQALTYDAALGLIGAFDQLYTIDMATGAATPLGSVDLTDGRPGTVNGVYSLAALVPPRECGDFTGDCKISTSDALGILRGSVMLEFCPESVCNIDGVNGVKTTDALAALRISVKIVIALLCPAAR